jgi:acid phosphatase family membrane protein YuiD
LVPIWAVVLLCGLCNQLVKLAATSLARGRLTIAVLGHSTGLPSLHAATMTCLAVSIALHDGAGAATTGVALVMAVIVLHDAMRLKGAAQQQRRSVYRLIRNVPGGTAFGGRVADYLDVRAHHPVPVLAGGLLGAFFALAFA